MIVIPLAFVYAYALTRSRMRFRGLFYAAAMLPLFAPSLLSAISLIYLFGNQGLLKGLLFGGSIYGANGIIVAQVFYCFPHALIIAVTALALADARLYEVADALGTKKSRIFRTVTLPGAKFGLINAAFVVFTLVVTDFGIAKVIGGQFNVLATDAYKQVVGQQNFEMGAVVGMVLLAPAVLAFVIDRMVQRRQVALLSARAVPLEPKPNRARDIALMVYCLVDRGHSRRRARHRDLGVVHHLLAVQSDADPEELRFRQFRSRRLVALFHLASRWRRCAAVFGTAIVFTGAYFVEKTKVMPGGAHARASARDAADGGARPRARPRLCVLRQCQVESARLSLRHARRAGDQFGRALLHGRAHHLADRAEADRSGVRVGVGFAEGAVLAHLHARHGADLPGRRSSTSRSIFSSTR